MAPSARPEVSTQPLGDPFELIAGQGPFLLGDTLSTRVLGGIIIHSRVTRVDPDGSAFAKIGEGEEFPISNGVLFTVRRAVGLESERSDSVAIS